MLSPEQSFLHFLEVDRCNSGLETNTRLFTQENVMFDYFEVEAVCRIYLSACSKEFFFSVFCEKGILC